MQSGIRLTLAYRGYLIIGRGESGSEIGVPGKFSEGDPDLEHSNECECDSGGVCPICYQRRSSLLLVERETGRNHVSNEHKIGLREKVELMIERNY